jgi:uncharacterized Tic20 family protein
LEKWKWSLRHKRRRGILTTVVTETGVAMEPDNNGQVYDNVAPDAGGPSKTERNWAMGCHLIALCGLLVPNLILGLIGTLVLWLLKRDEGAFIDDQGKEALNFQISMLIYAFVCGVLSVIVSAFSCLLRCACFPLSSSLLRPLRPVKGSAFAIPCACVLLNN